MSSAVLEPQGNNETFAPRLGDRVAVRGMGSYGPNAVAIQNAEISPSALMMITLKAVRQGPYPAGQTATPRFRVNWTAGGRGPVDIAFDAEVGATLALTGTGMNITAFFDDITPSVATPAYAFSWSSSHAYAAGSNCMIFTHAVVIPAEGTVAFTVPAFARELVAYAQITAGGPAGTITLFPDDGLTVPVGVFPLNGLSTTPNNDRITLSAQDRMVSFTNASATTSRRVHARFKLQL